jgi:hypothetical protein
MTDYWASEQSIGIVRHVFVHVRAKGFIAFLTRLAHAAQDCRHAAGVCALHLALRATLTPTGFSRLNLYLVLY